jgi:hypothetical protein
LIRGQSFVLGSDRGCAAVTLTEHGEWLVAEGRVDEAETLLAEARETFARLQEKPWLERVEAAVPAPRTEVSA